MRTLGRSFEEDDNAAEEVGDDLLQGEPDADGQGRRQTLELVPVGPEGAEHQEDAGNDDGVERRTSQIRQGDRKLFGRTSLYSPRVTPDPSQISPLAGAA